MWGGSSGAPSRPPRAARSPGCAPKTRHSTDPTGQDSGTISHCKCFREARVRVPRYGTVQWHRSTMEEDTDCFCYADTDELAAVKYGGEQAPAHRSPPPDKNTPTPPPRPPTHLPHISRANPPPPCH